MGECKSRGGEWYCWMHDPDREGERQDKLEQKRLKRYEQRVKSNILYFKMKNLKNNC